MSVCFFFCRFLDLLGGVTTMLDSLAVSSFYALWLRDVHRHHRHGIVTLRQKKNTILSEVQSHAAV